MADPAAVTQQAPNAMQWFNVALLGGLVGAVISNVVAWLLTVKKAKDDRNAAARQVQRDWHLKRRDHLSRAIALILELRLQANLLRKHRTAYDMARSSQGEEEQLVRIRELIGAHVARMNDGIVETFVEAVQYGRFPGHVNIEPDRLAAYARFVFKVVDYAQPDKDDATIRALNANLTYLMSDMRTLADYEERAAKEVVAGSEGRERLDLPYLAKVAPNVGIEITPLGLLDTSCVQTMANIE